MRELQVHHPVGLHRAEGVELGPERRILVGQHRHHEEGGVLRPGLADRPGDADELIAGYMPEVNILNGSDLYCHENELVGIP